MTFKIGDRVVCIDGQHNGYPYGPKEGEVYTIQHKSGDVMVNIVNEYGIVSKGWLTDRFRLYEPIKGTCDACNSRCKKDKICSLYIEE
jgi:hypothetical protein